MSELKAIDHKHFSYFIGYLAGDGAFSNGHGKRKDRMALSTTDKEVALWINENILPFDTSKSLLNDNANLGIFARLPSYRTTFSSEHSDIFNEYGILCKKDHRVMDSRLDPKAFILGLMDSDGSFSYTQRKDKNRACLKISITHPSHNLLSSVSSYLNVTLGIESRIRPKGTEKCMVLSVSKLYSVEKVLDWLYEDKFVVMSRKYEKYLKIKKDLEEVRKNGVCYPREFTTSEDYYKIVGSCCKGVFITPFGEFMSLKDASKVLGVPKRFISSRCCQNRAGYSKREKTKQEEEEYKENVSKEIKLLYEQWCSK